MEEPVPRMPIPFGPIPQQYPLTHMPQQQMPMSPQMPPQIPPFVIRQIIAHQQQQAAQQPMQQQPQLPIMMRPMMPSIHQMPPQFPVPDQMMRAPRPEQPPQPMNMPPQPVGGEIRIHLQRIPIPMREEPIQVREIPIEVIQARPNMVRPMPQAAVSSRDQQIRESLGLTSEDLSDIQRFAEERMQQVLRALSQQELNVDSDSSENDDDNDNESEEVKGEQSPPPMNQSTQQSNDEMPEAPKPTQSDDSDSSSQEQKTEASDILQIGRNAYGRSAFAPVNIPVDMMQKEASTDDQSRPHCKFCEFFTDGECSHLDFYFFSFQMFSHDHFVTNKCNLRVLKHILLVTFN